MPISASLHRASAGAYQNKLHDNLKGNTTTQAQSINPDRSTISNEINRFGSSINRVVNSHEEPNNRPSRQIIQVTLLMLQCQLRLADSAFSATNDPTERENGFPFQFPEMHNIQITPAIASVPY